MNTEDITTNHQAAQAVRDETPTGNKRTGLYDLIDEIFTGRNAQYRDFLYSMLLQNAENAEQWKMAKWQADWDSTPNQLKRWIAAGGNPNAFFEKNSAAAAPSMDASSAGGVGSAVGQAATGLGAITNATDRGAKLWWEIQNLKEDATTKSINNGTLKEMNAANLELLYHNIDNAVAQNNLTNAQARQIIEMLPLVKGKTEAEIEQIRSNIQYNIAATRQALENARYLDQRRKTEVYTTARERWANTFRTEFGIDPNSPTGNMLIQGILQGKGEQMFTPFFDLIRDTFNGNGITDAADEAANAFGHRALRSLGNMGKYNPLYISTHYVMERLARRWNKHRNN